MNFFGKAKNTGIRNKWGSFFHGFRPVGGLKKPARPWWNLLYIGPPAPIFRVPICPCGRSLPTFFSVMKVLSSLASAKRRHADCQVVKRKGTVYVICKSNPKFKARQGATPGTRLSKKGL